MLPENSGLRRPSRRRPGAPVRRRNGYHFRKL